MFSGLLCLLCVCICIAQGLAHRVHGKDGSLPIPHSVHQLGHNPRHRQQNQRGLIEEIVPVYPGYGTHFAYVYVGTPPQRQSVIIDTGSHYTAFPCTGCSQCGQHTDNYWNPDNSSTVKIQSCNNVRCTITQSYSEGSSWHAYKVVDKLWVGGLSVSEVPNADSMGIEFPFGCQTSESGLFRTQLADGIMGFSMHEDTLPYQLVANQLASSKIFALCFRVGGGIMTLAGVDQRIHLKPSVIQYTNMTSSSGWFSVELVDVRIQKQNSNEPGESLATTTQYCGGKGCIVDSGTTDTYLPASVSKTFQQLFNKISNVHYSSANVLLTQDQLNSMPNLIFVFRGASGENIEVEMPWTSYVDSVGGGKYAFRVYLSENSGTVLGANFMNGHNVIFDIDGARVGFARSNCKYEDYALTAAPTAAPTKAPVETPTESDDDPAPAPVEDCQGYVPVRQCDARCYLESGAYLSRGNQTLISKCLDKKPADVPAFKDAPCTVSCLGHKLSRGDPACTDNQWTECSKKTCTQSKLVSDSSSRRRATATEADISRHQHRAHHHHIQQHRMSRNYPHRKLSDDSTGITPSNGNAVCTNHTITRTCYTGNCPIRDGDYLVLLDMIVNIDPYHWSYVYEENFFGAFEKLFDIKSSSMQLLNDISREYTLMVKLHFEFRLRAQDYNMDLLVMRETAQEITSTMWTNDFKKKLIRTLDSVAYETDHIDYSRYGWMVDEDLKVLNAFAIPIGNVRPFDYEIDDTLLNKPTGSYFGSMNMFLVFIAISATCVLTVVCLLYYRLQREHQALHKRKSMGGSLHQMWNKFSATRTAMLQRARDAVAGRRTASMGGTYTGDRSYLETDVQMSRWSAAGDDQIDDEDYR